MKIKSAKTTAYILGTLAAVAILYGISWIAACGIIKLITMCFGWTFSWGVATGIWLILCLVKLFLKK